MWMAYAVAAAALWGLEYALMGRLFNGRLSPLSLLSIQMAVGAAMIGTIAIATGTLRRDSAAITSNPEILRLVVISSLVFTLGSYMIATSIKEGNALLAGLVEISYPLFILAFLIILGWNEPVGPRAIVGGILIIAGAVLVQSSI
jgi:drug/metabolite transporter (DMT)-like permease